MRLIWATRGRNWGFQFLRTGGYDDPLPQYEDALAAVGGKSEGFDRLEDGRVALRFSDPDGRTDSAGRVISHDFVIFPPESDDLLSLEGARALVWHEVADEYQQKSSEIEPQV